MNWYDKNGSPIDTETAGGLLADVGYKRVGLTEITSRDGAVVHRVSTVWLGLDHNYGDGPPILFETMVFGEADWADQDCKRYSTEAEALAGHAEMVTLVAATVPDETVTELDSWPATGGAA